MHFRYKVIMINITVLAIALGFLGFVIIYNNYNQLLNGQLNHAIEENNLAHSSVEYQLLTAANYQDSYVTMLSTYEHIYTITLKEPTYWASDLMDIGEELDNNILSNTTELFILYNNSMAYYNELKSDIEKYPLPEKLLASAKLGSKHHVITKENGTHYIYVVSKNILSGKNLLIVTKRNIEEIYPVLTNQIRLFSIATCIVLLLCSIIMYVMNYHLTKPLEQLSKTTEAFTKGNYEIRSDIHTDDEIGLLANKFNHMAASVSLHIEELNKMIAQREQFVTDFTHEVKTPMTSIIGYADTLRNRPLTEEQQKLAYEYIYSEGKRLESMSMKLFDLIYLSKEPIVQHNVSTSSMMQEVIQSVKPAYESKNITIHFEAEDCTILGNKDLLVTAFINMLDNSRKASQDGSCIDFHGYMQEENYVIELKDYGCGMNPETIEHIYDEFYMADKSRARAEGGAGIGMSLVHLILQKHNTSLQIESTLGRGSTFMVTLPLK